MLTALAALHLILFLCLVLLLGRIVLDWIRMLARTWRPRGAALVVAEGVYSATDPPVRLARRLIPPLRLGGMELDMAVMVLLLLVWLGRSGLSLWMRNL